MLPVAAVLYVAVLLMSAGDFILQMSPSPHSQIEVIAGQSDPDKLQRRGGITRLTVDVPSARPTTETRPPRWRTPEFFLYYVIFLTALPWMIYLPSQLSSSAQLLFLPHIRPTEAGFVSRDTSELQLVSS